MLRNKTAFITGGSRGIGFAICKRFLENKVRSLAYYSRNKSDNHDELEKLAKTQGADLRHYKGGVEDSKKLINAIENFTREMESLDILVNNAGITRDKLIIGLGEEDWDAVMNVNLRSVFISCRTAAKIMVKQRKGAMLVISSVVALGGNVGQSNYAASKAGIIGFAKSIAKEVAKRGVRVNVLAPGLIQTDMTNTISTVYKQRILEQIPLARMGTADEIANPSIFLCSDMASYITGQVIIVSGGLRM